MASDAGSSPAKEARPQSPPLPEQNHANNAEHRLDERFQWFDSFVALLERAGKHVFFAILGALTLLLVGFYEYHHFQGIRADLVFVRHLRQMLDEEILNKLKQPAAGSDSVADLRRRIEELEKGKESARTDMEKLKDKLASTPRTEQPKPVASTVAPQQLAAELSVNRRSASPRAALNTIEEPVAAVSPSSPAPREMLTFGGYVVLSSESINIDATPIESADGVVVGIGDYKTIAGREFTLQRIDPDPQPLTIDGRVIEDAELISCKAGRNIQTHIAVGSCIVDGPAKISLVPDPPPR